MKNAPVQFYTLKLKASGEAEQRPFGYVFWLCTEASDNFLVSFDGSTWVPARQRARFTFPFAQEYVWLKAPEGAQFDIAVSFYAAMASVAIDPGDIRNALTLNRGYAPALIPAGGQVKLRGILGTIAGVTYRKAVLITNNDPGSDLEVWDGPGTTRLWTVFARQGHYVETSDDLTIKNETATAIVCRICEIFYST